MVALVNFCSFCGCAGDSHELLIANSSTGKEETTLYYRHNTWSAKRAKKRLLKRLKKSTGKVHYEVKKRESL